MIILQSKLLKRIYNAEHIEVYETHVVAFYYDIANDTYIPRKYSHDGDDINTESVSQLYPTHYIL